MEVISCRASSRLHDCATSSDSEAHIFLSAEMSSAVVGVLRPSCASGWCRQSSLTFLSKPVSSKTDIWPIPAADKTVWVRIADPNAQAITLRNDSKAALHWLAQCFTHEFRMPLAQPPLLPCLSAADAMADGSQVGIGGWLCTSSQTFWFAQQWSIAELRAHWPFLTKDAQQYIACFETIAQWVLLQMDYSATGCSSLRFCLSDNSPTQASVNKLFTTAFPLSLFLQPPGPTLKD